MNVTVSIPDEVIVGLIGAFDTKTMTFTLSSRGTPRTLLTDILTVKFLRSTNSDRCWLIATGENIEWGYKFKFASQLTVADMEQVLGYKSLINGNLYVCKPMSCPPRVLSYARDIKPSTKSSRLRQDVTQAAQLREMLKNIW